MPLFKKNTDRSQPLAPLDTNGSISHRTRVPAAAMKPSVEQRQVQSESAFVGDEEDEDDDDTPGGVIITYPLPSSASATNASEQVQRLSSDGQAQELEINRILTSASIVRVSKKALQVQRRLSDGEAQEPEITGTLIGVSSDRMSLQTPGTGTAQLAEQLPFPERADWSVDMILDEIAFQEAMLGSIDDYVHDRDTATAEVQAEIVALKVLLRYKTRANNSSNLGLEIIVNPPPTVKPVAANGLNARKRKATDEVANINVKKISFRIKIHNLQIQTEQPPKGGHVSYYVRDTDEYKSGNKTVTVLFSSPAQPATVPYQGGSSIYVRTDQYEVLRATRWMNKNGDSVVTWEEEFLHAAVTPFLTGYYTTGKRLVKELTHQEVDEILARQLQAEEYAGADAPIVDASRDDIAIAQAIYQDLEADQADSDAEEENSDADVEEEEDEYTPPPQFEDDLPDFGDVQDEDILLESDTDSQIDDDCLDESELDDGEVPGILEDDEAGWSDVDDDEESLDEDDVVYAREYVKETLTGLFQTHRDMCNAITYEEFVALESARKPMTRLFYMNIRRTDVSALVELCMSGLADDVAICLAKAKNLTFDDLLHLRNHGRKENHKGVYIHLMRSNDQRKQAGYIGSVPRSMKGVRHRLATHRMHICRRTRIPSSCRQYNYTWGRKSGIKSSFRVLFTFDNSIDEFYPLYLEAIVMGPWLKCYARPEAALPSFYWVWNPQSTYEWIEQLRSRHPDVDNLPDLDWEPTNKAWPCFQGCSNKSARVKSPCTNCQEITIPHNAGGQRYCSDIDLPVGNGYICNPCFVYARRNSGKHRPIDMVRHGHLEGQKCKNDACRSTFIRDEEGCYPQKGAWFFGYCGECSPLIDSENRVCRHGCGYGSGSSRKTIRLLRKHELKFLLRGRCIRILAVGDKCSRCGWFEYEGPSNRTKFRRHEKACTGEPPKRHIGPGVKCSKCGKFEFKPNSKRAVQDFKQHELKCNGTGNKRKVARRALSVGDKCNNCNVFEYRFIDNTDKSRRRFFRHEDKC